MSNSVTTANTKGFKIAPLLNGDMAIVSIPRGKQVRKMNLEVTGVHQLEENEVLAELYPDTYHHSYLINFSAIEGRNFPRIMDAFQRSEDFAPEEALDVIPWESAKGMQFSHRVNVFLQFDKKTGEVLPLEPEPMQYDTLTCNVKYAKDKEGNQVYGNFDIKGYPIDEDTPENMKGKVIEIGAFTICEVEEAETVEQLIAKASRKHASSQATARVEVPTTKDEVEEPVKAKVKA